LPVKETINSYESEMSNNLILTEAQMVNTFGRETANRVRMVTTTGEGVFDEFKFKGRNYLCSYEYYSKSYYVLTANNAKETRKQQGGTIITVRTKQVKKPQARRLQMAHS
jgi:hypothetical protein